jgi:hypothetical protein
MTKWRMGFACRITKATDTHSEYVILTAFPLQQKRHELNSRLRYTWHCVPCCIHKIKGAFPHTDLQLFLFIHWYQLNMVF